MIQWKKQYWVSGQLKKKCNLHELITGQQIPCFDSCQLSITWMFNITHVPMVTVLLSYFSNYLAWRMGDGHTDIRTYRQSHDNQNSWDRWVTKFSKVWGSDLALCAYWHTQTGWWWWGSNRAGAPLVQQLGYYRVTPSIKLAGTHLYTWLGLFERWITLSTGYITIQRIAWFIF